MSEKILDNTTLAAEQHARESVKYRDWQPIETAPKDGTPILVANNDPSYFPRSCWWSREYHHWVVRENIELGEATFLLPELLTHWMHLPGPPTDK